jgi:hypothetical protein
VHLTCKLWPTEQNAMIVQREKPKNSLLAQCEDSLNVTVDPQLRWLNHSGVIDPGRQKLDVPAGTC